MLTVSDSSAEQLLQDLVAIPSPSCHEREAAAFLTSWMGRNGYDDAFIDEAGNAVGIIGSGRRQIVLLGHIDTYVGFPPVRLQDRILYGRGSVDAKGPLCTFAASASSAKLAANVQVIVIGAVEEEAATSRGARHALTQYQPEYCVIGEPSRWDRITLGYKGRLLLDWRWEGGLTHSAGEAPSPAERALAYWQDIKIHCDQVNAGIGTLFARLDPSIRDINTWQEGVNGVAEMTVGFRLPPDLAPGDVLRRFPAGDGATVSGRGAECAFSGERNSELSPVVQARHSRRRRPAAFRIQNRHIRYEHRRAALGLPDCRLWTRRFRARP